MYIGPGKYEILALQIVSVDINQGEDEALWLERSLLMDARNVSLKVNVF
jgi:hypothetical protein